MPLKQHVEVSAVGKHFAALVRERDLPVESIWVRKVDGMTELWVVSAPVGMAEIKRISELFVDLQRAFPEVPFDEQVLNPAWIPDFQEDEQIPSGAKRIELRG